MNNNIKAVLFDLDGTLVRMTEKDFTENYLARLCALICPLGYDKDELLRALWAGVGAMIKNDGTRLNRVRFWDTFAAALGDTIRTYEEKFNDFYATGAFRLTREITQPNPDARTLIDTLHERGVHTVLATNPLFPVCAQHTRLSWVNLFPKDFEYITHYDNCSYCKPSVGYYRSILDHIGLSPDECIMIGNSVNDDILPAQSLGIAAYLVTGYASGDIACAPDRGNFSEMTRFLLDRI